MSNLAPGVAPGGANVRKKLQLSSHGATPEVMAAFFRVSTEMMCARDQTLFRKGDPAANVYLVLNGRVRLTMPLSRGRALEFEATTGSLVGLPAVFSNSPYSLTAIARRGAHLARLNREEFIAMLAANPALSLDLLKILAEETRGARTAIVELGVRRREGRQP